jgi:chloride channel protein, CIC family
MKVIQKPDLGPAHGNLLVLAILVFAVGAASGHLGAVFRPALERSDPFRDAVIDWANDKEIVGFALVIGTSAIASGLAAWLVRKSRRGQR